MIMGLDDMKAALPGVKDQLHELLGCEFGHGRIAHQDDLAPCDQQAVQIVALHDGPHERRFKLCEKHRDLVLNESTPR